MSITRGQSLYECVFYNSRRSALFVISDRDFSKENKKTVDLPTLSLALIMN